MAGRSTTEALAPSSPIRKEHPNSTPLSPPRRSNAKERKNPSITPRKFRRFFTPRPRVSPQYDSAHISPARKALRALAAPNAQHRYQTPAPSSPAVPLFEEGDVHDENIIETARAKRRKINHSPESSPCRPQPLAPGAIARPLIEGPALLSPMMSSQSSQELADIDDSEDEDLVFQKPIRRLAPLITRGMSGHLIQRETGSMPRAGRSYMSYPVADWKSETADFYTRPDDVHESLSLDAQGHCIPFCTATCNTNSLVAVGDEEGRVRLLESDGDSAHPFANAHLSFQPHTNAIIDMSFSCDDYLLATASGDQTGRVIDMMTQTPTAVLSHHTASLKQVRFQPGKANSSVLATSSRDGSVQIWDLRCTGPVSEIHQYAGSREAGLTYRVQQLKQGCASMSIKNAHARTRRQVIEGSAGGAGDLPSRTEQPGRIGDVSVTALQFLPEGQEHLLLTACEADASIKLWDIRATTRSKASTPLSATVPPTSHSRWRPFGISSLALGADGARLYALCKDNTVYAYSMPHLILGHAPELSTREPTRRRVGAVTHHGLGPMYGFRHPNFHAATFYVKCAVRPARDGRNELLAVGSSDGCAVVFPTAERYFRNDLSGAMSSLSLENSTIATATLPASAVTSKGGAGTRPPLFQRANSTSTLTARGEKEDIPITRNGTPLVRAHGDGEVGAVAWTDRGKLITMGDDYNVRCWHEDREKARDLRVGGEVGGRRWGCGWADVGQDWDGDSDDDE